MIFKREVKYIEPFSLWIFWMFFVWAYLYMTSYKQNWGCKPWTKKKGQHTVQCILITVESLVFHNEDKLTIPTMNLNLNDIDQQWKPGLPCVYAPNTVTPNIELC